MTTPALTYGIAFFLGIVFVLAFHPAFFLPLAVFLILYRKKLVSISIVFSLGFIWALVSYSLPPLPEEGLEGEGTFHIESISHSHSPFQKSILFKGILKRFSTYKNIPCSIYFREKKPRPEGSKHLSVTGRLVFKGNHRYVLKLKTCEEIPDSSTLAGWRFGLKNKLRSHLEHYFSSSKSRAFLLSMVTGEIDDRLLALEFNRLGLLHLLGISGFQFALLAFLLGSFLRLVFSFQIACFLLLLLLSAYTFILGDSPPIERAWVGTSLYLIGCLCGLRISPLQALGMALLWQLVRDPLIIFHLGFQFSFLCTFAILTLYPFFQSLFLRLFPKRTFQETLEMDNLDKHGYLLSCFWRETAALNLAIHLFTLPLIFYHFHKFPILSLLYNLFLPAGVSIMYLFLILGLIFSPLPLMSTGIYWITDKISHFILKIATHPPALYDFQWRVSHFSLSMTVVLMTLIILFSMKGFKKIGSIRR